MDWNSEFCSYLTSLGRHEGYGGRRRIGSLLHTRQSGFDHVEAAHQIHVHHEPHLVQFLLLQLLRNENPLVHDQHVDGPSLVDRPPNGVVVSDVGGEHRHVDAGGESDGVLGFLELVEGPGEDGDFGALGCRLVGQGEADAARSTGDEHVAALDGDMDGSWPDYEVEENEESDGEEDEEEPEVCEAEVRH